jgi:streptomycin 6-kinase
MPLRLPTPLVTASSGPEWAAWAAGLPRTVSEVCEEWSLSADGEPLRGTTSLVLPVRDADGGPAVLKLTGPDPDLVHEHLALRDWEGRGAVRLLRADPRRRALLLERLHAEDLSQRWDQEACEVVAGLYAVLHVPAAPQLRRLSASAARWADALGSLPRDAPLPRRLVEQAASLAHGFAGDPDTDGRLVHGDLHYENVLAAERAPWLAIDPQPRNGDPHYEPAPLLWNRLEELSWPGSTGLRDGIRQRFHTVVDVAGLDEHRARDWVVVRLMVNALWELQVRPERPSRELLTACVTVAKAVQD